MKKRLIIPAAFSLFTAACAGGDKTPAGENGAAFAKGPDWYKHVVFYQIWVRSFYDSDGDGIGDLRGVIEKMDHIASLGAGGIWLSPFYPTPYHDSGYDVADYEAVNPEYGTMADLQELLDQAHSRGIRVFADLVMNHTSDAHSWFVESRSSKTNPKRDWYVWAATPNMPCKPSSPEFGEDGWTLDPTTGEYYYHRFYPEQPDLNYRNPAVAEAMLEVPRFWLDKGFDGFRVDAITTLVEDEPGTPVEEFRCDNHPLTHVFLKRFRAVLDEYPDISTVAEAWADAKATAEYFGGGTDEFHMSFSLSMTLGMQTAVQSGDPRILAQQIEDARSFAPPESQFGLFLSNHDRSRVMATVEGDEGRAALAAVLLLTLPGTPFVYYGDEVGLGHGAGVVVDRRDRSRTPMPWTSGPGVGFTSGTPWLDPAPGAETANVASQETDPESLLALYRRAIDVRNKSDVFGTGDYRVLGRFGEESKLLVFLRSGPKQAAVVALNFSDNEQTALLDLSGVVVGRAAVSLSSGSLPRLDAASAFAYKLTLAPYGYAVWTMK